ncbi:hypothetical protein OHA72_42875 [Dactylosporangium sp. NBC_01737]|uniref:hypothetical protein n=1 Tax=Dactylosporangium sp. NBC_01737 TaxID=2975959 RepID=UPI002E11DB03|nr:hypothetical protein OHA72_42875 [Dactylosporangium sp. NBC_01737]
MMTFRPVLRWHRPLLMLAAVMALLVLVCVTGLLVDDRRLLGVSVWLKPLKFGISFAVYAMTLAWMLTLVTRGRRIAEAAGTAVAVAGAAEVGIIAFQAARGHLSHYNVATDLDDTLWMWMGITIGVLWVATLVLAVVLFFAPIGDPASRWAVRLGVLVALGGMAVGLLMLRPTPEQRAADVETVVGAHSVGVPDGGPGMPLTGWSLTGGDLRIAHFVGMHGLQALPLLAMLLAAVAGSRAGLDQVRRGAWCWWGRRRTSGWSCCSPGRRCAGSRCCPTRRPGPRSGCWPRRRARVP